MATPMRRATAVALLACVPCSLGSLPDALRAYERPDAAIEALLERHAPRTSRRRGCRGAGGWQPASLCDLVRNESLRRQAQELAPWRQACDGLRAHARTPTFVHYALTARSQSNAGDFVLPRATQMAFEFFLGVTPRWVEHEARAVSRAEDIHEANRRAAAVVVGGGGLFYPANVHSRQNISGWQWQVHSEHLRSLAPPLYMFGVGWNGFRDQERPAPGPWAAYLRSLEALAQHPARTVGLRESYSLRSVSAHFVSIERSGRAAAAAETAAAEAEQPGRLAWRERLAYQPCATTLLSLLQPCLLAPSSPRRGQDGALSRILSVNIADDQLVLRLGSEAQAEAVLTQLATWLMRAHAKHWTIHLVMQGASDTPLLDFLRRRASEYPFPYEVISFNLKRGELVHTWGTVLQYYRKVAVAASMRGHGVMIPFGLGVPTISLVTHEKVRTFAEDIGHPEWAVELTPRFRTRPVSELADELTGVLSRLRGSANRQRVRDEMARAQRWIAAITAGNMLRFAGQMGTRLRKLERRAAVMRDAKRLRRSQ